MPQLHLLCWDDERVVRRVHRTGWKHIGPFRNRQRLWVYVGSANRPESLIVHVEPDREREKQHSEEGHEDRIHSHRSVYPQACRPWPTAEMNRACGTIPTAAHQPWRAKGTPYTPAALFTKCGPQGTQRARIRNAGCATGNWLIQLGKRARACSKSKSRAKRRATKYCRKAAANQPNQASTAPGQNP